MTSTARKITNALRGAAEQVKEATGQTAEARRDKLMTSIAERQKTLRDLNTKLKQLEAEREAALDDAEDYANADRAVRAADLEAARTQDLIKRDEGRLQIAECEVLKEQLARMTEEAVIAVDRVLTAADAAERAAYDAKLADQAYQLAVHQADDDGEILGRVRELATQLGVEAPDITTKSAETRGALRRAITKYDLAVARVPAARREPAEHAFFYALLAAAGVHNHAIHFDRYSRADRIRDLRKDPAIYQARCMEILELDKANAAVSTAEHDVEVRRATRNVLEATPGWKISESDI